MSDSASPQAPATERSLARSRAFTAWMFCAHLIAFLVLIAVLGGAVPSFVEMYESFDAEVPPMTQWVFRLSRVVVSYWYLILPLGMGVDAVIFRGLSLLPAERNWLGTLWAVLVLVATILLLGVIILAAAMPVWSINFRLHP